MSNDDKTIGSLCARMDNVEKQLDRLLLAQTEIIEHLSLYRGMVRGVKLFGTILLALLAFKFGDALELWDNFME